MKSQIGTYTSSYLYCIVLYVLNNILKFYNKSLFSLHFKLQLQICLNSHSILSVILCDKCLNFRHKRPVQQVTARHSENSKTSATPATAPLSENRPNRPIKHIHPVVSRCFDTHAPTMK